MAYQLDYLGECHFRMDYLHQLQVYFSLYFPWIDISKYNPGLLKVHPTQLYETFISIILFFYLYNKRKSVKIKGSLFFLYLILAGFERFFVEFIRTNEKYFLDILSGAQDYIINYD